MNFQTYFENTFMDGVDKMDKMIAAAQEAYKKWYSKKPVGVAPADEIWFSPLAFTKWIGANGTTAINSVDWAAETYNVPFEELKEFIMSNPKFLKENDFINGLNNMDKEDKNMAESLYLMAADLMSTEYQDLLQDIKNPDEAEHIKNLIFALQTMSDGADIFDWPQYSEYYPALVEYIENCAEGFASHFDIPEEEVIRLAHQYQPKFPLKENDFIKGLDSIDYDFFNAGVRAFIIFMEYERGSQRSWYKGHYRERSKEPMLKSFKKLVAKGDDMCSIENAAKEFKIPKEILHRWLQQNINKITLHEVEQYYLK
jgi:hypothetical protein